MFIPIQMTIILAGYLVTISSGFYPVAKDVHFEFQARPIELQEFLFDTRPPPPPITSTTSLIR